jgi:hypothetical protein
MTQKDPKGRICETTKKIEYERKGCLVVPTGKGHDFLAVCPNKKPTFVEVKKRLWFTNRIAEKN